MDQPLYSTPRLTMRDDVGQRWAWQAHLTRTADGTWKAWSDHGSDEASAQHNTIAASSDVWEVVDCINERLDGRAKRGYRDARNGFVWISDELVEHLRAQGIDIPSPPDVGPSLTPLSAAAQPLASDERPNLAPHEGHSF